MPQPEYYIRRTTGFHDPNSKWDLHLRIEAGTPVKKVTSRPLTKKGYVFYKLFDYDGVSTWSGKAEVIRAEVFSIYFRKPTQDELALLLLRDL